MTKQAVRDMLPTAAALTMAVHSRNRNHAGQILAKCDTTDLHNLSLCLAKYVQVNGILNDSPAPHDIHAPASRAAILLATRFNTTIDDIRSPKRDRANTEARMCISYVARLHGMTFSEIGRYLNKDHSTVMNAVTVVGERPRLRRIALEVARDLGWDREEDVS